MKHLDYFCWSGTAFGTILTAIQTNVVFQYIQLGLTILSTIVALLYTIWKWWRKAKQDGKIDEKEVDELMNDVNEIVNKKGEDKDD